MRKILFRGKTDKGEWVQGDLSQHKTGKTFIKCGNATMSYEVIPASVGQFISLKDKNGRKIFEGDIVKTYDEHISEIVYWGGMFCRSNGTRKWFLTDNMTVIGNIHDNPELL